MYVFHLENFALTVLNFCLDFLWISFVYCLFQLDVPVKFMRVALDEGPGPNIKYQCPELTKLHQVVSQLIRCCDVSSKCHSSQAVCIFYVNWLHSLCCYFIKHVTL